MVVDTTPPSGGPDAVDPELAASLGLLRRSGARFAYLHGSRVGGRAAATSDTDVAAWFGTLEVDRLALAARLPEDVDLLVLDGAPLELAGRVALHGRLLFDLDPVARVRWEADTRKRFLDERPRRRRARQDFAAARAHGRR